MAKLDHFDSSSLAEQILILDEIERENRVEALSGLLEIYGRPGLDAALRQAVADTLWSLFSRNEELTAESLASKDPNVRRMCAQISGQRRFPSAVAGLLRLGEGEDDPEQLVSLLAALGGAEAAQTIGLYRKHVSHPDPLVSALSIEMLGRHKDVSFLGTLCQIVDGAESDERYRECDIHTEKAIGAIGAMGTDSAVTFLVTKIHHRNPTARRLVHQELIRMGSRALPFLAQVLESGSEDEKILAANTIGLIGDRRGSDALVAAFDRRLAERSNVRYALYEALGKIPCLKGLCCLLDGLGEGDEMILTAVVDSLEHQLNPDVVAKVLGLLRVGDEHSDKLVRAIISSRAGDLFAALYEDAEVAGRLVGRICLSKDPEVTSFFREKLSARAGERAKADAAKLAVVTVADANRRLLVVDDSKSVLLFYKSVISQLDADVATATNGREALDRIENGEMFDLIITDLNMPVMNGLEFTRKVRSNLLFATIPILMATTESEASQKELAANVGVTCLLHKPLKPEALQEAIRRFVSGL